MGGGVEAKSDFLSEIKPHIGAIIEIAERYSNPPEGEGKPVAIVITATDQDAEVNTVAVCGRSKNIRHALCEFAWSNKSMEKIFMSAASYVAIAGIGENIKKLGESLEAEKAKDGSQE